MYWNFWYLQNVSAPDSESTSEPGAFRGGYKLIYITVHWYCSAKLVAGHRVNSNNLICLLYCHIIEGGSMNLLVHFTEHS